MATSDDPNLYQRIMESGAENVSGSGSAPSMYIPNGQQVFLGNLDRMSSMGRLGDVASSGHGVTVTMPGFGGHLLTVGLAALTGFGIGSLASQSWRGGFIGAGAQLGNVGLVNAAFGKQFVGTWGRVAYGILGAAGLGAAMFLAIRASRRK